jgi:hypothetical protein
VAPQEPAPEEKTGQEMKEERRIRLLKKKALLEQIRVMKEKETRRR